MILVLQTREHYDLLNLRRVHYDLNNIHEATEEEEMGRTRAHGVAAGGAVGGGGGAGAVFYSMEKSAAYAQHSPTQRRSPGGSEATR